MTDTPKDPPPSAADDTIWHTSLAAALGDVIGVRPDGKPDLGALVVPLLRSGVGAALIGSLLGVSTSRAASTAAPAAAPDLHPVDGEPGRHGGASSPLAAILPPR